MLKRILTGIVLIVFVLGMVYLGATNYLYLDMLVLVFSTVGCYEIFRSFRKAGYKNCFIPLVFLAVAIYPLWHFVGYKGLIIAFSVSIVLALICFTFKSNLEAKDLLATIFTIFYPYGLLCLAWVLTKQHCAVFAISYAVFIPVFSDTFAYFVGSAIKGKKLCPNISPKKTVAGCIGGLFGAILCSVIFYLLFEYFGVIKFGYIPFSDTIAVSVIIYIALGLLGGIICQLGDLAASRIKRALGIKDFGNIFPGHGGALDRLDSIMFMLVFLVVAFEIIY